MDLDAIAAKIWGYVRLAQHPLSPSTSRQPIVRLLEELVAEVQKNDDVLQRGMPTLDEKPKRAPRQSWSKRPGDAGYYLVIEGSKPPVCMFWDGRNWTPVVAQPDMENQVRVQRVYRASGRKPGVF